MALLGGTGGGYVIMEDLSHDEVNGRRYGLKFARPVAQLAERWTPGGESPGSRRFGARYMKLLMVMARLVGAAAAS